MSLTKEKRSSHRILVSLKQGFHDSYAEQIKSNIIDYLDLDVEKVKIKKIYGIKKSLTFEQLQKIALGPLVDPIVEEATTKEQLDPDYDWTIEIGFKPGMTDNTGKTAQITIEDYLGTPFYGHEEVHSATQYLIKGAITLDDAQKISKELLANELIETITIHQNDSVYKDNDTLPVDVVDVHIHDKALIELSEAMQLALNLQEMQAIRSYYSRDTVIAERKEKGLPPNPSDVEIEALAQTWSEHCKHKIFNARITYNEGNHTEIIDSLFKTYIKRATDELSENKKWLVSVFTDNAGIIKLNDEYNVCFKVETHNSPSALDPYGGALTGILGVNRDIIGAGIAARIVANTDIFCFAPPNYLYPIPKKLHHPKRIFEGVRKGVEHGGNKSGVPTVNGAIVFDDRFLGKPLVYCGTVGILPHTIHGKASHLKEIVPGDRIIIAGGRTGRDGIHGATFSSEELNEQSCTSAVQIGDPFTQKKLHDFIIEARDYGLYRTLTDNGAGGFSSSIGELAEISGGCEIHIDHALLKSPDLKPWEVLLSESQERMTLVVDQKNVILLKELAQKHEVEVCDVGLFTNTGYFHVTYHNHSIAYLPMDFLHDGLPQMDLMASWSPQKREDLIIPQEQDIGENLKNILSRYNVCSKESVIRQYDHEVQGGSALKPLTGVHNDGPSDAAIIRPIECLDSEKHHYEGIVISNGICPKFSDIDTYAMAASAIDEAIRNFVAVGGNPEHIAILDNFCWPDPVLDSKKNPDGKFKLAQLVRANKALYKLAIDFETPIISGKDSMKNDFRIGDTKISVPPTLLISAFGKIHDIRQSVSMDFKCSGDIVYILGVTKKELGGTEYANLHNLSEGEAPTVNAKKAKKSYVKLHQAIIKGYVASCHDCSDGGLAVAAAEAAFAGMLGVIIDLDRVPKEGSQLPEETLFSESNSRFIITVAPENSSDFEKQMIDCSLAKIGEVDNSKEFVVLNEGVEILKETLDDLKSAWQQPLQQGGRS
ncbi:MAG: phosphoribosylformylglycinamidine synthase subunit PurL [Chlamydiota bacterium]